MPRKPKGTRKAASGADDRAADTQGPEEGDPIEFEILAPGRPWVGVWEAFVEKYRSWWDRVGGQGPVYVLPKEIIGSLATGTEALDSSHRPSKPLITLEDARAERVFLRVCERAQETVGVWDGKPIAYQLLTEPAVPPVPPDWQLDASVLNEGGSLRETKRQLGELLGQLGGIHHQLLGYVGRLTFDEQYRGEKATLQTRWESLPERPPLPLDANVADLPPVPVGSIGPYCDLVLADEVVQFLTDFGRFMRKWRINRMVTWDLPWPQGPLDQIPLGMAVSILGPEHRVDTIPSYYDIPSGDIRKAIRGRQKQAAADDGIEQAHPVTDTSSRKVRASRIEQAHPVTDTSSRKVRASRYESAFRLWQIEQSIRRRYDSPRGLVARLLPVFANLAGVSEYRVQQLRQLYRDALDDEG